MNYFDFDPYATLEGLDPAVTKYATSQWQTHFVSIVLAHIQDLGFPAGRLKEAVDKNNINQILNPALNPWLIGNYRTPIVSALTGIFFQSYSEMAQAYKPTELQRRSWWSGATDVEGGYPFIARGAAQLYGDVQDGAYTGDAARQWFNGKLDDRLLNEDPKWAFTPRPAGFGTASREDQREAGNARVR